MAKITEQVYRVNFKLRRQTQAALDQHIAELKSEDFDNDEEYCMAVASELLSMIRDDRDFLFEQDSDEDE